MEGVSVEELEDEDIDLMYHSVAGYSGIRFDLEFHGVIGKRDTPSFFLTGPTSVRPMFPEYAGVGLAVALDLPLGFGLKAEGMYFEQEVGFDDFYQISTTLERRFRISDHFIQFNFQYFGEKITEEGIDISQRNNDPKRLIKEGYGGKVELGLSDEFIGLSCKGIYDNDDRGYIVQPEISVQVWDSVLIKIYADIMGGPEDSALGQYRDRDVYGVTVLIKF